MTSSTSMSATILRPQTSTKAPLYIKIILSYVELGANIENREVVYSGLLATTKEELNRQFQDFLFTLPARGGFYPKAEQ